MQRCCGCGFRYDCAVDPSWKHFLVIVFRYDRLLVQEIINFLIPFFVKKKHLCICLSTENWGLVTYREVDLLIDVTASNQQKQRVVTVVTHELAHQWFG